MLRLILCLSFLIAFSAGSQSVVYVDDSGQECSAQCGSGLDDFDFDDSWVVYRQSFSFEITSDFLPYFFSQQLIVAPSIHPIAIRAPPFVQA